MATKLQKLGTLIKEARTNAGLTQVALAEKIDGLSASDISKAEHGEKELTQEQLKAIAKATGVTQKSLLEAAGSSSSPKNSSSSSGSSSSKKTSSSSNSSSSKKTTSDETTSMKLTATEKKLVELYRKADSNTKKETMKILKGEGSDINEVLGSVLESALSTFMK